MFSTKLYHKQSSSMKAALHLEMKYFLSTDTVFNIRNTRLGLCCRMKQHRTPHYPVQVSVALFFFNGVLFKAFGTRCDSIPLYQQALGIAALQNKPKAGWLRVIPEGPAYFPGPGSSFPTAPVPDASGDSRVTAGHITLLRLPFMG